MFRRTAVEPTALSTYERFAAIRGWFGFSQSRVVAELPESWVQLVYEQVSKWPDGWEKASARELLRKLKTHALVNCATPYDPKLEWIANASLAQAAGAIDDAVARDSTSGLQDLLTYLNGLEHAHTEIITHNVDGFATACRRPLEWARAAVIVDPFFDPTRKQNGELLAQLVRWSGEGRCRSLEVYARHQGLLERHFSATRCREACQSAIRRYAVGGAATLAYVALDDPEKKLHRRMLLTERVGLGIDYGFKLDPRRRSEVTILAEETRQEMINDFVDGRHGLKEVFRVYGVNPLVPAG